MDAAPRIDERLRRLIDRVPADASAADVTRRVGAEAEALGLSRPSYQQIRVLLGSSRRARDEVTNIDVLVDIALRARPAYDLPNRLYGDPLPDRPGAKNEPRRT
ncbi:MAG: hypothetical protein ACRDM1_04100 [Gaiellaceae bacterium]